MSFVRLLHSLLLSGLFAGALTAQNLEPATGTRPAEKPTNPALIPITDEPGLPRVMLIGDSISMGYTLPVRAAFAGRANVHRPLQNCGDTARGLAMLKLWLGEGRWDVIHFNFGLHDLKYLNDKGSYTSPEEGGKQVAPPEVYRQRLRDLTVLLQATGAKLVFATTTPVPEGTTGRVTGDEKKYNAIAAEVMKELGVPVNDLCGYVDEAQRKLRPRGLNEKPAKGQLPARTGEIQLPFNVHFTDTGSLELAKLVTTSIERQLPSGK